MRIGVLGVRRQVLDPLALPELVETIPDAPPGLDLWSSRQPTGIS